MTDLLTGPWGSNSAISTTRLLTPTGLSSRPYTFVHLMAHERIESDRLQRDHSMLTFENSQTQGVQAIVTKLSELPFKKVAHRVSTLDAQPSSPQGGGVIVMVTGELLIDEEQNAQRYSQVFHLLPEGGSFYVLNGKLQLSRATTSDSARYLPTQLGLVFLFLYTSTCTTCEARKSTKNTTNFYKQTCYLVNVSTAFSVIVVM